MRGLSLPSIICIIRLDALSPGTSALPCSPPARSDVVAVHEQPALLVVVVVAVLAALAEDRAHLAERDAPATASICDPRRCARARAGQQRGQSRRRCDRRDGKRPVMPGLHAQWLNRNSRPVRTAHARSSSPRRPRGDGSPSRASASSIAATACATPRRSVAAQRREIDPFDRGPVVASCVNQGLDQAARRRELPVDRVAVDDVQRLRDARLLLPLRIGRRDPRRTAERGQKVRVDRRVRQLQRPPAGIARESSRARPSPG